MSGDIRFDDESECRDPWLPELSLSGDFTMKPGCLIGPRTLEAYELVFFPYGTATTYTAAGLTYTLAAPCVTITRPHELHACRFDPARPVRHLFVVFDFPQPEGARWFGDFLRQHTHIELDRHSPVPTLFKHALRLSDTRKPRWRTRCSALLFSILEELRETAESPHPTSRRDNGLPHQLQLAIDYMRTHVRERVSMEALALRIGWSHAYFTRAFTRSLGVSPNRYLNRLRIEHASRLLLHDTLSVKEIAAALGFDNEHYFSRLFKHVKGVAPTAYREQNTDPRFRHVAISNEEESGYPHNHYFHYA